MRYKTILAVGAALVLSLGGVTGAALATEGPTTKTVEWVLAAGSTPANPFAGGPQHLYTGQCGTGVIQADVYKYATEQQRQFVDQLIAGGVLDHYADSPVFLSVTWGQQTPCVPEKPVTPPTYSEWTDTGTAVCGDTTMAQERTETDTEYTLVNNEWVPKVTTTTQTQTRQLTAAEIAALGSCSTTPPAPTPPALPTAPPTVAAPAAPVQTTAHFTG